jgi:hypothetical protein
MPGFTPIFYLEKTMSDNRRAAANRPASKIKQEGAEHAAGGAVATGEAESGDGVNGTLAVTQQCLDWMGQWQRAMTQAAIQWSDTLVQAQRDFQDAKTPLQLASVESQAIHRQFEEVASQTSAFMQQLFDAQLFINGLVFNKPEVAQKPMPEPQSATAFLQAWGNAQDGWLSMTRSWIDAANAASANR